MKSYKVFVSSTFVDLKKHRARVISALRKAGFFVDPMEDWTAATDEPKRFSQARIEGCDLCILLIARRRGHVPRGEHQSITQMEVDAAVALGVPVLVFMLDDSARWPARFDEMARDRHLRDWRRHWSEAKGVGFFGANPGSIDLAPALTRWVSENSIGARDEARAGLAKKINAEVIAFLLAIQMAERGMQNQTQQKYDEAYLRWEHADAEIAADLDALGVDAVLHDGWRTLSQAVLGLYRLSGTWSEPWRGQVIDEMKTIFPPEATDWTQLADVHARRTSNRAFQEFFAAWWNLREIAFEGCAELGRRLRAS